MANVPESSNFDAGIYQIETADEVLGGANGTANKQAKGLANRTRWLKDQITALFNPAKQLANPGYYILPGGLIMQWKLGALSATQEAQTIVFPIPFPTACFGVWVSTHLTDDGTITGNDVWYQTLRNASGPEFALDQVRVYSQWSATGDFPENGVRPLIFALGY